MKQKHTPIPLLHPQSPRIVQPTLRHSLVPVAWLLCCVMFIILTLGPDSVLDASKYIMLTSAALAVALARWRYRRNWRLIGLGVKRSWRQMRPALIVLLFIALVSTMWTLSGVVPTLITYGLNVISPRIFLPTACVICAAVSVFTGSSWTTIATLGVALQGIGTVFGYGDGWIAGAIISGAYFGDKISPLSDTTVLASSSCGVPLLDHVRYMLYSTLPTIMISLTVYTLAGILIDTQDASHTGDIVGALQNTFNITSLTLIIPLITAVLIGMRLQTVVTLACSTFMGLLGLLFLQPQVFAGMVADVGWGGGLVAQIAAIAKTFVMGAQVHTGNEMLDVLCSTGGMAGMWSTISLVLSATVFGGVMIGTGMLGTITGAITHRVVGLRRLVVATVGTGLFLNSCTADQFLSIILGANIYKNLYRRQRLEARLLSRTIEDSTSVTSVLIPWNSCSMTQSAVLGVSSFTFIPYCVFNYLSPLMSIFLAFTGLSIRRLTR